MELQTSKQSSIRSDPFYEEPLHKAYYYPSPPRFYSKRDKQTTIHSPARGKVKEKISPAEKEFLKEGNVYTSKTPALDEDKDSSSKFDESWPASERPSISSMSGLKDIPSPIHYGMENLDTSGLFSKEISKFLQDPLQTHLEFPDEPVRDSLDLESDRKREKRLQHSSLMPTSESTLSKYIDRFRNGPAMSRTEREQLTARSKKDFWWLGTSPPTPSDSSTPKDDSNVGKTKGRTPRHTQDSENAHALRKSQGRSSSTSSTVPALRKKYLLQHDLQTNELQHRAQKLIEKSESSLNSSDPIVSTEGNSSSNGPPSTFDEAPYRPGFIRAALETGKEHFPLATKPKRPEDDILVQWRMRRKMDIAKDKASGQTRQDKYKSQVHISDVESKLADFRKKLAGGLHEATDTCIITPPAVSTTEPKSIKESKATSEDDRIEKPAQSDAVIQTSPPPSPAVAKGECCQTSIASPSLVRPGSRKKGATEPHYHLSCDILPCNHKHPARTGNYREDSDSSFERLKTKHVRQLKNETGLEDDTYWKDLPEHDGNAEKNERLQESGAGESDSPVEELREKKQAHTGTRHPNKTGASLIPSGVTGGKRRRQSPLDVERCASPQRSLHGRKTAPNTSSPLHPPLNSAVGQVIRDRLFTSSVEVMSSIDTTVRASRGPPGTTPATPTSPDVKTPHPQPAAAEDDNLEECLDISDGEEFPDDDILKDLRQKRLDYVGKLQEIEQHLADVE